MGTPRQLGGRARMGARARAGAGPVTDAWNRIPERLRGLIPLLALLALAVFYP